VSHEPLTGRHVTLLPLAPEHHGALCEVGLDPELWRFTAGHVDDAAAMSDYISKALRSRDEGSAIPFAIRSTADERIVGSTRFGNIDRQHRRVEIGWTWIARPWQRSAINTEAKFLMLRHAFEESGCIRVEFKTDARNERSRRAILRLGAVEEGTLRHHMITSRGHLRDTVYYSILAAEWPAVRARLEHLLTRGEGRSLA